MHMYDLMRPNKDRLSEFLEKKRADSQKIIGDEVAIGAHHQRH